MTRNAPQVTATRLDRSRSSPHPCVLTPQEPGVLPDPLLTTLQRATAGLQFPSEPAAPLEPFVWEEAALTPATIRQRVGYPVQVRCQTITAAAFFADVAEVAGFTTLYTTLLATLTDLQVYLYGEVAITVYVVGRDTQGRLAGFTTHAVEA